MTKLTKAQADILADVVTLTRSKDGMCYLYDQHAHVLIDAGYVEPMPGIIAHDPRLLAIRATQAGMAY